MFTGGFYNFFVYFLSSKQSFVGLSLLACLWQLVSCVQETIMSDFRFTIEPALRGESVFKDPRLASNDDTDHRSSNSKLESLSWITRHADNLFCLQILPHGGRSDPIVDLNAKQEEFIHFHDYWFNIVGFRFLTCAV